MSTRSTMFLTSDNEHCYYECSSQHRDNEGKFIGYDIHLEVDKKNLSHFECNEDEGVFMIIPPGSEIYTLIQRMDVEHPDPERFPTKKELFKALELARMEIKSCYSKLGYNTSNVLESIDEILMDKLG